MAEGDTLPLPVTVPEAVNDLEVVGEDDAVVDAVGGAVVGGSACPPSPRPPKYLRTSSLEQHRKFYSGYKQTNQKTTYRVPPVVAVAHFANVFF